MENVAYYNGKITAIEDMMVPANDRGFVFGDGIYEAGAVYNHKIFAIQDHLDRMFNSAHMIGIELPFTKEECAKILQDVVDRCDDGTQFLYWQVTRGTAMRSHTWKHDLPCNLYIYTKPFGGVKMADDFKLISVPDTRFFHCNIKTLNLLVNVMAAQKAHDAGCQEAIFVRDGFVTEGAHTNCHIIKNGTLITHPLDNLILPGTERKHIIRYCRELGIPVEERAFTMDELKEADEVFVTSTSLAFERACEIDGQPIGLKDHETCKKLRDAYMAEVNALYE